MREGENPVYDLFIFFVRIWWNIFKLILVVVYYLFRIRPTRSTSSASPAPSIHRPQTERRLIDLIATLVIIGVGCILAIVGVSFFQSNPYSSRSSGEEVFGILLIVAGIVTISWGGYAFFQRVSGNVTADPTPKAIEMTYTIRLPRTTQWDAETALSFVNQLIFSFPYLVLSISADREAITWQVLNLVYGMNPETLERLIRSSYPEAEIAIQGQQPQTVENPFYRFVSYYGQANMFVAPLRYVDKFKSFDPLNALTQAMNGLRAGERITYVLALAGSAQAAYKAGERLVSQSTIHPLQLTTRYGVGNAIGKMLTGTDRMDKYETRDQKALEDKLREKLYYAYLLIQVDAPTERRVSEITILVDAQIEHFTHMPYNALSWVERPFEAFLQAVQTPLDERMTHVSTLYRRLRAGEVKKDYAPPVLILEPREIAALWHLPAREFGAQRVAWSSGLIDVPEEVTALPSGLAIGTGKFQGRKVTASLPLPDRVTHLNIVGRTGMGKSTLLHTLIQQDIARGAGVAVIDPHGQLVQDVLRNSIPPQREADVVVLDIANQAYPPPFNPLSSLSGYTSSLKVISLIERLFAGTEGAARMASYLRAALLPLQSEPHATMRDVARMFMDDVYREQRLTSIDDPETIDFWDYQYNSSSTALQRQIAEPVINRVRPFYANPYLYPVFCHPDTLDFHALMEKKKIILVSLALDEEQVPEQERNLIGALLMSQLQMSGMKASALEPFYLYVDEVQRFVTTSLPEMLSEARKYGLSLITANQYLGQLTGKTLEAVMGNVGATVIFRCSPEDAHDLAAYTQPQFDAQALLELHRFQAVVKTQINGQSMPAFNLFTKPPVKMLGDADEREQRIRQQSIATYTPKSREEVLAWLKERYPRRRATATPSEATPDEARFYDS
ncbi:MAG: DUF87 domain-containing protein [Chloroflexota bacterium]